MRALRSAAFALAEGVRLYLGAGLGAGHAGEFWGKDRPLEAELMGVVESGRV